MNFNMNNAFVNRLFRPVDNMVWDMSSGQVGILEKDGIVTVNLGEVVDDKADNASIVINPLADFSMQLPAFAQSVPVDQVKVGDMIFQNDRMLGWVTGKKANGKFELLKKEGTSSTWTPPSVKILGFDTGVLVLRSLINMLPGGETGFGDFKNMLLPLMMMSGGDASSFGDMMPMLLMSQMGVGGMTPAAGGNMLQTMMMMSMMKNFGNTSSNKGGSPSKFTNGFFDR